MCKKINLRIFYVLRFIFVIIDILKEQVIKISNNRDERNIFLIPPNSLNEGSLFGGMLKLRNAIEAVILVAGITIPILKITVFSFTAKTILLCLTALPIGIFALIGVGGESLTAFLLNFFRFLRNRKMQYRSDAD